MHLVYLSLRQSTLVILIPSYHTLKIINNKKLKQMKAQSYNGEINLKKSSMPYPNFVQKRTDITSVLNHDFDYRIIKSIVAIAKMSLTLQLHKSTLRQTELFELLLIHLQLTCFHHARCSMHVSKHQTLPVK